MTIAAAPLTGPTLRRFHLVQLTVYTILVVSYMLVLFHRIAPAVVASDLMRAFGTTAAALGSLAAMYYYTYTIMQIPAGVIADTLGVRVAAGAASVVAGIGSIVFGLAPDFITASVGRLMVGLGVSVVFVGLMRASTVWWPESRFGFVSGLTMLLGNLGAILAAGPLAAILAFASWRTVFIVLGALNFTLALLMFAFVRDRPEDAGFPSLREMEGKASYAPPPCHWFRGLREVLGNPAVWPVFWVNLGMTASQLAFVGLWGVPLLRDLYGLTRAEASLYTTTTLAALAMGSLAFGWLSDYLRLRKPVLVGSTFTSLAVWLGFLALPWGPGWSGFVLYALVGFCAGGFIVTYAAAKEVVAPTIAGMAIAVANTGVFLGAALAQPLFGLLLDWTWDGTIVDGVRRYRSDDYANGLALYFGLTLLSAIASLRVRETHCRNLHG